MKTKPRQNGFSLLETLLAVGTLAIGMVFVAGTFLAGTFFTTLSTERTVAMTVADEAFAKMRLHVSGVSGLATDSSVPFDQLVAIPSSEYTYPSTEDDDTARQYSWRALCREVKDGGNLVQCTVFVSRRVLARGQYYARIPTVWADPNASDYPELLRVAVEESPDTDDPNDVVIIQDSRQEIFINDGAVVVDNLTGELYRVLERFADRPTAVKLDRPWVQADGTEATEGAFWVLSPSISGGRNPFIAVYQKVLKF